MGVPFYCEHNYNEKNYTSAEHLFGDGIIVAFIKSTTKDWSNWFEFIWSQVEFVVLSKLRPSTKTISLRLPESMLDRIRLLANRQDVPYQSLIKVYLQERIDEELQRAEQ